MKTIFLVYAFLFSILLFGCSSRTKEAEKLFQEAKKWRRIRIIMELRVI